MNEGAENWDSVAQFREAQTAIKRVILSLFGSHDFVGIHTIKLIMNNLQRGASFRDEWHVGS